MTSTTGYRAILLEEPFRLFFPLGVVGAVLGLVPWIRFMTGGYPGYPGTAHGLLQIQGFEMAFAVGFLMTALPRFLETTPTRAWELGLGWLLCAGGAAGLVLDAPRAGEALFLALMAHVSLFGLRRLRGRGDDPPPFFAFIPLGFACGVAGAVLILWPAAAYPRLGELLVQQGIMLCFVLAVGSHLAPRLLHGPRPFPETTTRAAHRRLAALFVLGLLLLASFPLEAAGHARLGPALRALVVTAYLLRALGIHRPPTRPLLHLHLLRLALACVAGGLWWAALDPPRALAWMHLTLVGGFGLLTFVIATRVTVGHTGFEDLWEENRPATLVPLGLIALSVPVRLAAAALPAQMMTWVAMSTILWLAGVLAWGLVFVPKLAPWHVAPDD